jgi:hypothetical protein
MAGVMLGKQGAYLASLLREFTHSPIEAGWLCRRCGARRFDARRAAGATANQIDGVYIYEYRYIRNNL